jgi:hypothetical protein
MDYDNIYKAPSSKDLCLIERIIEKYGLEDASLNNLSPEERNIILSKSSYEARWAMKVSFKLKEHFPISLIFFNLIFNIINQKITKEQLPHYINQKTSIPLDICESISQEIFDNEDIQYEINAIRLDDDILDNPEEEYSRMEQKVDEQEELDEKILNRFNQNNEIEDKSIDSSKREGGGLGQDLL